ncbi:hypothetical protein [Massilia sp. Root351]|jgi:hypothetical protein|uniref:hypothetical protein n=1 Tax=Massilia sp. Root351 TaxID=1736522 RepID=UPI000B003244|nr:hypothetical protein [Massilia sp. Root351]
MNKDLYKGALIMAAVLVVLVVGGFALSDNGVQKAGCVGRAIASGISLGNIASVCGLGR